MRAFIKKYFSDETKDKLRAKAPAFMFQKKSYSQCGEDLLVAFVLNMLLGSRPKIYLDIGANHPFHLSNTALLYQQGGRGYLVEPDPRLASLLKRRRPRDKVLQVGIHFSGAEKAPFFILNPPTLNTFSRSEMERCVAMGHTLTDTVSVNLKNVNAVLELIGDLDFLNIDTEGLDKAILEMIDWNKHRPTCICVETLSYDVFNEPKKITDIVKLMLDKGYILYADTYINSIFVDAEKWQAQWVKRS
jgi:FkbM family methyltransferase